MRFQGGIIVKISCNAPPADAGKPVRRPWLEGCRRAHIIQHSARFGGRILNVRPTWKNPLPKQRVFGIWWRRGESNPP